MPTGEIDISWQVLRQIVHDWAGTSADLGEVKPLTGGCVNTTLALKTTGGDKAVLKITPHRVDRAHADEQHQLDMMRQAGVPVPQVYRCHIGTLDRPFSYILLEFVEGVNLSAARHECDGAAFDALQAELAELLLKLHRCTGSHYMKVSSQETKRFDDWAPCFRETYDPIWHDVEKSNLLPPKCRKTVAKLHERLGRFLANDGDGPRLVHGDLWSTNLMVRKDESTGRWHVAGLLDPNCKFAHAESELAYLELFHTVTPAFMRAYQQARRLPNDYHQIHKPIYQLYSLLDHLHTMGPHDYLKLTLSAVERVGHLV